MFSSPLPQKQDAAVQAVDQSAACEGTTPTEGHDEVLRALNLRANELKHQYGAGGLLADLDFYHRYLLSL